MNRRHVAALIPLQMILLVMAIRNIDRPEGIREIAGWLLLAGVLVTLIGYALAWRRQASQQGD
jgi:hypothetical protein